MESIARGESEHANNRIVRFDFAIFSVTTIVPICTARAKSERPVMMTAVIRARTRAASTNDGISIKLSALHPRYEDAQHVRVMNEWVLRVWGLCVAAAQVSINLTIDAEEVDRLEWALDVFEALAAQVAQHGSAFAVRARGHCRSRH